jgi:hypothetical protein
MILQVSLKVIWSTLSTHGENFCEIKIMEDVCWVLINQMLENVI